MVIKRMIGEGKLPHFKAFLEQGAAHESLGMLGVNPTVTPPNWASMATGNWPRITWGNGLFLSYLGRSIGYVPNELGLQTGRLGDDLGSI